jgi:hypothetical protein
MISIAFSIRIPRLQVQELTIKVKIENSAQILHHAHDTIILVIL